MPPHPRGDPPCPTPAKITIASAVTFLTLIVFITAGAAAALTSVLLSDTTTPRPSSTAPPDIPTTYLTLHHQGATACPAQDWATLTAIGKIESDHGRSTLPGVRPGTVNAAGTGAISGGGRCQARER